jgi:hypothetical protein
MDITGEDLQITNKLLEQIAFSLERSASAAEATHKLYKKANDATERAMTAREEREREINERQRDDFSMSKERHEAFMRNEKLKTDRETEWLKKVKEAPNGNIISNISNDNK